MQTKIAVIGDLSIFKKIDGQNKLKNAMLSVIKNGDEHFFIGYGTNFDNIAFDNYLTIKNIYPNIKLSIVVNNVELCSKNSTNFATQMNIDYIFYDPKNYLPIRKKINTDKHIIDNADKIIYCLNDFCYSQYKDLHNYIKTCDKPKIVL